VTGVCYVVTMRGTALVCAMAMAVMMVVAVSEVGFFVMLLFLSFYHVLLCAAATLVRVVDALRDDGGSVFAWCVRLRRVMWANKRLMLFIIIFCFLLQPVNEQTKPDFAPDSLPSITSCTDACGNIGHQKCTQRWVWRRVFIIIIIILCV